MVTVVIVSFIAGLGAGLVTGLAGMSAAVVVSPMLISLCGMSAYQAVSVSLASDVVASAVSAYTYGKNGNLDVRNGLVMMASVMLFTALGSWLASHVPNVVLGGGSFLITIFMGIRFLRRPIVKATDAVAQLDVRERVLRSVLAGIPIGLICGFIGAGGGMMMLFMLTSVLGYRLKTAVGTSTFIMTFTALTGAVSHIVVGGLPNLAALVVCVVAAPIGARLSALLANRLDERRLNQVLGGVLLALGVVMAIVSLF